MGRKNFNKKITAAVRVILLIGGALLGAALAVLFFRYNFVDIPAGIRIAVIVSCGALLGLFLMLSTRPIIWLVYALGGKIKDIVRTRRPEEIAGYALGIAFGVVLALALYIGLMVLVPLPALNIALTFVAAIVFAFVGAIVFSRIMSHEAGGAKAETEGASEPAEISGDNGYIVTGGAFFSERAQELLGRWLTGKLAVLETTGLIINESESEKKDAALRLYGSLTAGGRLKVVAYSKSGDEAADIAAYAAAHRLAVITGSREEAARYEGKAKVLCLEAL